MKILAVASCISVLSCMAFGSPVSGMCPDQVPAPTECYHPAVTFSFCSLFHRAAAHNSLADAKAGRLLKLDPNSVDRHGFTPLHTAVKHGHLEMVRWFIENGANLNAQTENGLTPLVLSIMNDHEQIAMRLLDGGAEPLLRSGLNGWTAVHYGVSSSFPRKLFQKLARMGIHVNLRDKFGNTPLMLAIENGSFKVLSIFQDFPKLDWDQFNDLGETALHIAAMRHSTDFVQRLLWAGANPNIRRRHDGFTPLHICAVECQIKCVRILLMDPRVRTDILDADWRSASQHVPATDTCMDVVDAFAEHYQAQSRRSASQPDFLKEEEKAMEASFMPASRLSDSILPKSSNDAVKLVHSLPMTTTTTTTTTTATTATEKLERAEKVEDGFTFPMVSPNIENALTPKNPFLPSMRRSASLHSNLQRHNGGQDHPHRQHHYALDVAPLEIPEEVVRALQSGVEEEITVVASPSFRSEERPHSGSLPRELLTPRRMARDSSPPARRSSVSTNPHRPERLRSSSSNRSIGVGVRRTRDEANSVHGGSGDDETDFAADEDDVVLMDDLNGEEEARAKRTRTKTA